MNTQDNALETADDGWDPEPDIRPCEGCGRTAEVEQIPFHGYSKNLCRGCSAAAYRSGEAV